MKRFFCVCAIVLIAITVFAGCSDYGGLPNGRYENIYNSESPLGVQSISAIIIDGNNWTQELVGVVGQTVQYKYKNDTLTLYEGSQVGSMALEFDGETITFAGMSFKKVK